MIKGMSESSKIKLDLSTEKLPKHVAFIMDGNGRWATKRFLPRLAGHNAGVEQLRGIIRYSSDIGITHVTFYAFSTENWNRPKSEVSGLMNLLVSFLKREIEQLHTNNVKIVILGDTSELPEKPRVEVLKAVEKTSQNTGLTCAIALNYGSRDEILRATKEVVKAALNGDIDFEDIDLGLFESKLYTSGMPDPDLMIRTSGELRLSNYLLWQLAYTEFYFTDVFWPDFNKEEYKKALTEYQGRKRRYGKL
ncbi:MAG: isoprenyl transferase [Acidaminobacteraceae bacterium]